MGTSTQRGMTPSRAPNTWAGLGAVNVTVSSARTAIPPSFSLPMASQFTPEGTSMATTRGKRRSCWIIAAMKPLTGSRTPVPKSASTTRSASRSRNSR